MSMRLFTTIILLCSLLSQQNLAQKPTFTFADTYPTNNVDSLELWLKTHPQPTEERLKNLIRLHRTSLFIYNERYPNHNAEIIQLARRFNNPIGQLIYYNITKLQQALEGYEALKDTSGIIYTLATMADMNYDHTLLAKGDEYSAKDYLHRAKQLLKIRFNAHDYFMVVYYDFTYQAGKANSDNTALLASLQQALRLCESRSEYQYIWPFLKINIAITHYYQQDYAASYATNKEVLARLKPNQRFQILTFTQNLANDCEFLKRYDERLALCYDISKQIRVFPQNASPYSYLNLYISFKEEMDRRGRYREASQYGDSIVMIQDTIYNMERNQKLIEFQAEHKQKQITELTFQKQNVENRNRFILTLLVIAVVVALVVSYLGIRLRNLNQSRQRLFAIIAHDLRRPMHAFHELGEVISFYLQKHDYSAINQLSQSLNQSGIHIQKMLDNMLAWALSERNELPHHPERLHLRTHLETVTALYQKVQVIKNFKFEINCPTDLYLWADPNALDLILRNLIDNSSKVLPPNGQVQITATLLPDAPNVQITLTDNGSGLSNEQLALVSHTLSHPNQTQVGTKGLGMGLIMVGRFIARNAGQIEVESKIGQGTTFLVRLPRFTESSPKK